MKLWSSTDLLAKKRYGLSLTEVVVSLAITSLTASVMVSSYVLSARSADWVAHSSAADMAAQSRIEQTRAAKWDTQATPIVDELVSSNFPPSAVVLNVPVVGAVPVYGTNITTVTLVSEEPRLKMVQVDCVWPYPRRGLFTNTVIVYRGPDQ